MLHQNYHRQHLICSLRQLHFHLVVLRLRQCVSGLGMDWTVMMMHDSPPADVVVSVVVWYCGGVVLWYWYCGGVMV